MKKPVTEYAKTKWDAEEYLNSLNNKDFTICRLGLPLYLQASD